MEHALITTKEGMTRIHRQDGKVCGVTVLSVQPTTVTRQKTVEKDGYQATVVAYKKKLKEVKGDNVSFNLEDFKPGQTVTIKGVGKGKGFAGTIKRHGFSRGPVSHGSHNVRQPGSAGSMYPQHVQKGQKMPGRMGNETVTTRTVVEAVLLDESIILVRGAVPGSRKSTIVVYAHANN